MVGSKRFVPLYSKKLVIIVISDVSVIILLTGVNAIVNVNRETFKAK